MKVTNRVPARGAYANARRQSSLGPQDDQSCYPITPVPRAHRHSQAGSLRAPPHHARISRLTNHSPAGNTAACQDRSADNPESLRAPPLFQTGSCDSAPTRSGYSPRSWPSNPRPRSANWRSWTNRRTGPCPRGQDRPARKAFHRSVSPGPESGFGRDQCSRCRDDQGSLPQPS